MLSRCPQRLPLAASINFSTSRWVKCSRGLNSALGRRNGVTVRFSAQNTDSLGANSTTDYCVVRLDFKSSYGAIVNCIAFAFTLAQPLLLRPQPALNI